MIRHHLELEERQPDRPPMRRLALVPSPADGEAFHSWFFRLVETQHSHRDTIAPLLGLPAYTPQRYTLGEDFLTIYDGEYIFENLRDATGLRARAMMRMALVGQGGQFITYSWTGTTNTRPWPWRTDTAAVCPRCLADPDPIWRITWHLLPCVVCPIHRVYLIGWCPSCHTRISVGDTPRYRRECNGPFGPQGRIVGVRNCRQKTGRHHLPAAQERQTAARPTRPSHPPALPARGPRRTGQALLGPLRTAVPADHLSGHPRDAAHRHRCPPVVGLPRVLPPPRPASADRRTRRPAALR
ncbi:TniQ family protein [Sphaerisporangium viridialbum]|uniref:TniQ family protein n=1 Tax=Sphaerisporangium viridialbum TaxID=46189 RepID=UPI003C746192